MRWESHPHGLILEIPRPLLPVLGVAVLGLMLVVGLLFSQSQRLQSEMAELRRDLGATAARERDLEDAVVQQHRQLQERDAEMEEVRRQLAAIEMQLDGIDMLSQRLRESLGLEPATGTWDETGLAPAGDASAQGGPGSDAEDRERLVQAQRRLVYGMAELQALIRASDSQTAEAGKPAEPELTVPANWPVRGRVTSGYGWRVFRGRPNYHTGIDIAVPYGSPVAATGGGLVLGSGWQPGFGWSVFIQHAEGYQTLFGHLSETLVEVGDRVAVGDAIGLIGNSGNSTGPHVHYEIWKDGHALDPRPIMDGTAPAAADDEQQ